MKVDPTRVETDLCQTSIDLLRERVGRVLREKAGSGAIWFADHHEPFPARPDGALDIVLFGGFFRRFLESGNWAGEKLRLWVLCEAAREAMVSLLGVPRGKVGLIPRHALFTAAPRLRPLPASTEPFTLVFAGRISATKNIEMLLRTVQALQTEQGIPASLALCGDFDDQAHPDHGRRDHSGYERSIRALSASLAWKTPPAFLGKKGPWEWLGLGFRNPVLVNFSTFISEDFDVSLAQARGQGWPAWISDWGGHRDESGPGLLKIPPIAIGHSHEPSQVIELKAQALAHRLAEKIRNPEPPSADSPPTAGLEEPGSISAAELDDLRRAAIAKLGPDVHRVYRESLESFADTDAGKSFFDRYRAVFSGRPGKNPVVILVNDLHESSDPSLRDAARNARRYMKDALANGEEVVFLSLREIRNPQTAWPLLKADRIILPFRSESVLPLLAHWKAKWGVEAPVTIHED